MRFYALIGAVFLGLAQTAQAETLPVAGIYPAGSDEAATLQSIAVENFGGTDGMTLGLKLEDFLRDVYIFRRPWFQVMPASGGAQADGILRGTATADVRNDNIRLMRSRCQKRDEEKKCIEYKDVEVDCIRRTVTFNYSVRLVRWQGELVFRDDGNPYQTIDYCPRDDDNVKTVETMVSEMVQQTASALRYDLAPYESRSDYRVMETRKGMKKEMSNAFKAAIALTKRSAPDACDAFEAIAAADPVNAANASLAVNRGLCAEMNAQMEAADAHYRYALQLSPKADYASDGLRRVASRLRADRQMAAHWPQQQP